ncbi:MAG: vWA domain-containing protein [Actinomycetes bacterium]
MTSIATAAQRSVGEALRGTARAALVLLVTCFGLAWQLAPAQASEEETGSGRMVLVLDSSGSMEERAAGGETKIAAAKKALNQVIGSLPEEQAVGLRVYGAKVFSRNQPGACTDSQLVVPVDTGNRSRLRSAVASYRPYGETPIGHALREAGKDLGGEGRRTIVLVSDGESTCDPDPCEVARELSQQGVELKIDVVGLHVDGAARDELRCIAGAGNGTYYDVDSSEEFAAGLEKLATRAARPFSVIGEPVAGTPTTDGAPTITAGDWVDELGVTEAERTKHYLVEREIPGSTLHVSASVRSGTGAGEKLEVELTASDGAQCSYDSAFTQLSTGKLMSAGAAADGLDAFGSPAEDDPCVTGDRVVVQVLDKPYAPTGPRPLEIRVLEEPPVEDSDALPEQATDAQWANLPSGGTTRPTTGGSSFQDAPLLEPGRYRDTLVPGEVLTYQVEVEWGQQLAVLVNFPTPPTRLGQAIGQLDMTAAVDIFGPSRRLARHSARGGPPYEGFLPRDGFAIATMTSPVRYLNRGGDSPEAGAALAGRYTVTVFLEEDPDRESYVVPFTLDLGVTGAVTGAPTYTEEPADIESSLPSPAPEEPPAPDDTDQAGADADDGDGGPSAGFVVGGLGLVALLAAAYVALRARSA